MKSAAAAESFEKELLRDELSRANLLGTERVCVPMVRIRRTEAIFELKVVAPGIRKEDFTVEISNGFMKVGGRTSSIIETEMPKEEVKVYESVSFEREFLMPQNVDISNMKIVYANEVLKVTLPKIQAEIV